MSDCVEWKTLTELLEALCVNLDEWTYEEHGQDCYHWKRATNDKRGVSLRWDCLIPGKYRVCLRYAGNQVVMLRPTWGERRIVKWLLETIAHRDRYHRLAKRLEDK